jgi:hypothetical protein
MKDAGAHLIFIITKHDTGCARVLAPRAGVNCVQVNNAAATTIVVNSAPVTRAAVNRAPVSCGLV